MAVLGFLLPWSVMVVGARGNGDYFDDWGLASPTHMLIVLGLLGRAGSRRAPDARPGLALDRRLRPRRAARS